jgi:hypothetical protein
MPCRSGKGMQVRARTSIATYKYSVPSIVLAVIANTLHGRRGRSSCALRQSFLQRRLVELSTTPQAMHGQPNGGSAALASPRAAAPTQKRHGLFCAIGPSTAHTSDWRACQLPRVMIKVGMHSQWNISLAYDYAVRWQPI